MENHKIKARAIGIVLILSFIAYGFGTGLISSLTESPNFLANIQAHKMKVVVGALLIAFIHTILNIGLASLVFPIINPYNKNIAYSYFSAVITATILLIVGAIFLLLLIPLSDESMKLKLANGNYLQTLSVLCTQGNFYAYQLGMSLWGVGGLMLCYLLYTSTLIPKFLSVYGFIGYVVFIIGTLFELMGNSVGLFLSIPGGLFEISLSIWLIIKGFA